MMNNILKLLLILLISSFLSAGALAAQFSVIPEESTVTFEATQNNVPVKGSFALYTADIRFNPGNMAENSASFEISLDSLKSDYDEVASTLKGVDWFNSAAYPKALFRSERFIHVKDKEYQVSGTLNLKGRTKPVTLDFTLDSYSPDETAKIITAKIHGTTVIKRTEFGVGEGEWAKTDTVKDAVTLRFSLTAKAPLLH